MQWKYTQSTISWRCNYKLLADTLAALFSATWTITLLAGLQYCASIEHQPNKRKSCLRVKVRSPKASFSILNIRIFWEVVMVIMVIELAKTNCGSIINKSRKHYFCFSLCNLLRQGTCTLLLRRSERTENRSGLFWANLHWSPIFTNWTKNAQSSRGIQRPKCS